MAEYDPDEFFSAERKRRSMYSIPEQEYTVEKAYVDGFKQAMKTIKERQKQPTTNADRTPAASIMETPAVGEWKFDGDNWFCSKCNYNALCDKDTGEQVLSVVCPNCGAPMGRRREDGAT